MKFKKCVIVCFAFGGPISQQADVMNAQIVNERNLFLLFSGELYNGHYDVLLSVQEKERTCSFGEAVLKNFPFEMSTGFALVICNNFPLQVDLYCKYSVNTMPINCKINLHSMFAAEY
jgi:hypothetical protein